MKFPVLPLVSFLTPFLADRGPVSQPWLNTHPYYHGTGIQSGTRNPLMTHAVTEFPYPIVTGGGYPTHTPKGPYPSGTSVPAAAVIGKGAQHLELWPSDWDSHKSHPHLSSTQVGAIAPTGTSDKDEVYVEKPGEATIATGNKPNSPVQKATETGNQYNSAPSEIDEGPENSVEQNIDDALEPLRDLHEDLV
ncbi:hypothetical protein E6O75_ATG00770 [Venturia nashicola]|uniref:Uncharacterized protein n=1 Tax=Venturia nashicola TaxID=86259 RepID=A0A4Z1PGD7_9PEZI|nr:hypothetical protein E6O75_ATG00770 [Venturia nashicola]